MWISFVVLFTLAVVFAASWWMFFALARRWTWARPSYALSDWAYEHGFRFARAIDSPADVTPALPLPPPLDLLQNQQARVLTALTIPRRQLIEFRWKPRQDSDGWTPGHVLLQTIDDGWPATGLRPAEHATSLLDQFIPVGGEAIVGSNERFAILGHDPAAARLLLASSVRALLPPDVGFLLHGHILMLDFSARPFDPIELVGSHARRRRAGRGTCAATGGERPRLAATRRGARIQLAAQRPPLRVATSQLHPHISTLHPTVDSSSPRHR
jgi:hypothetical protein